MTTTIHAILANALSSETDAKATPELRTTRWQAFANAANADPNAAFELLLTHTRTLSQDASKHHLAELLATKALSLEPNHPELVTLLSARYIDKGLHAQALVLLESLRAAQGDTSLTDRLLGQAAWRAGRGDLAAAAFYRIASNPRGHDWESLKLAASYFRFEKARPSLRMLLHQMTELRKDDPEVCLWLAEWLIDDNDLEAARTWLNHATAHAAKNSELFWHIWRARFALDHPADDAAYRKTTAGIFQDPPEQSFAELQRLATKFPDFWEAHFFLGTSQRRLKQPRDAAASFEKVLTFFDYPNAWLELGALYGELGEPTKALEASLKADRHFEGGNHIACLNAAAACLELKRLDEADSWLAKARKLRPDSKALARLTDALATRRSQRPGFLSRLFRPRSKN